MCVLLGDSVHPAFGAIKALTMRVPGMLLDLLSMSDGDATVLP